MAESDNMANYKIMKSDLDWSYGIMLAIRSSDDIPRPIKDHVEAFIDHCHRVHYCMKGVGEE